MTQKIKIISCTKHRKKHYDYSELIGKEFNVKSGGSKYYNLEGVKGVILKSDCEEVSAPESQAHLLTERSEPCGNCKETIKECACMRNICFKCNKPVGNITFSVCDECWNILHPPKNNSAKELLASQPPVMEGKKETLQDVIKRVSPFGTMTISNPKMLIALEDFIGQKTKSLQSEVEQLKGIAEKYYKMSDELIKLINENKGQWHSMDINVKITDILKSK